MKTWIIKNIVDGVVLGAYEGETEKDALDAMARAAGFKNYDAVSHKSPCDGCELSITEISFPPVRSDLSEFERVAAFSVDVIVRLPNVKAVGRYIHGLGEWQVDGYAGVLKVVEWWPLPKNGTGSAV